MRVRRRPVRQRSLLRDLIVIVIVAVVASVLIKTFLIRSFYIPSESMEPTLLGDPGHHDRILVDELVPRVLPVQRGDVVVFTDPGGWLGPAEHARAATGVGAAVTQVLGAVGLPVGDEQGHLVKRVIGLPGDRVTCCTGLGQLSVNGVPLDEPYVRIPPGLSAVSGEPFAITVPPRALWVMGDNRYESADSRAHPDTPLHGAVPVADVVGRAVVVSWPLTRWRWLGSFPEVFAAVPSPR